MIKRIIVILMMTLAVFVQNAVSQELKYNIGKIRTIDTGRGEGEIGYDGSAFLTGGVSSPSTFCVFSDSVYVPDTVNERINVYNSNLDYMKTIELNDVKEASSAYKMKIDSDGNIIVVSGRKNLIKINSNGQQVFFIERKTLPNRITHSKDFHIINNRVLFKNDKNEIQIIDQNGSLGNEKQAFDVLGNEEKKSGGTSIYSLSKSVPEITADNLAEINKIKSRGNHIIVGDRFYSSSIFEMKKYFDEIKTVLPEQTRKKLNTLSRSGYSVYSGKQTEKIDLDLSALIDPEVIGYDVDHNIYWKTGMRDDDRWTVNQIVVVFSKYGDLLDLFQYGRQYKGKPDNEFAGSSNARIAIASNGDVWFMRGNQEAYHFWKVERQW